MRNKNTQLISSQEWFTTTESATSIWRWMGGEPSRYTAELMSRWKAAVQSGKVRWMSRNRGGGRREREREPGRSHAHNTHAPTQTGKTTGGTARPWQSTSCVQVCFTATSMILDPEIFKLVVAFPNRHWHHLRQLIRVNTAPSGATEVILRNTCHTLMCAITEVHLE